MFCKYCGKEILDNAVICVHCGVMVDGVKAPKKEQVAVEETEKKRSLTKIFGILSVSFLAVAIFFCFLGISTFYLYIYSPYSATLSNVRYLYQSYAIWEWIFAWIALGFSIATFIIGRREKENAMRFISTLIFIFAICWWAVGLVLITI